MTVLSLPPFSIILLVPVSFSVLLLLLRAGSVGAAALVGWAFGLGQALIIVCHISAGSLRLTMEYR